MLPTENPWPLVLLASVVAAALAVIWYQRQQPRYLAGVGLCVVAGMGAWLIDRAVVTERERLVAAVRDFTTSFQQRELERTVSHVSKQAIDLKLLIGTAYNLVEVHDDMRVSDVRVDFHNEQTRAVTKFRVNATVTYRSYAQYQPTRWELTWQTEGGEWRIVRILELDPLTGEPLDRLDRLLQNVRRIYR